MTAASSTPDATRLRLLWLTQNHPPGRGGMAQSSDRIVWSLRAAGAEVDVAHFERHSPTLTVTPQRGGQLLRIAPQGDPAHAMQLLWSRLEAAHRPADYSHVVAFGGVLPLLAGPAYAAWAGRPLVTLFRGNDFDAGVLNPKRRELVFEAVRRSSLVGTVTRQMAARVQAMFPEQTVRCIGNGIVLDEWCPSAAEQRRAAALREAMGGTARTVIGLFGELKRKKGCLLLLEAIHACGLADRVHLLLVGDMEPAVQRWLDERGQAIDYTARPFMDRAELPAHYLSCDWVALPSYYDGMPNVLLEAAALGRPLLAARTGGMADVLHGAQAAWLFEPGDIADCAAALRQAITCADSHRQAMGEAARTRVHTRLGHEVERDAYLRALLAVAADSARLGAAAD